MIMIKENIGQRDVSRKTKDDSFSRGVGLTRKNDAKID